MTSRLKTEHGAIAYHKTAGVGPGIVFLGGFKSDMDGSKAIYLEEWAKETGRAFLRFDYTGHGKSDGDFVDGCIGDWARDAMFVLSALTEGPQILVGSSMGGWISLIVAQKMPEKVVGLIGIAAAPDFTENSMWKSFDIGQRAAIIKNGYIELPSDYSDEPYIITKKLIEDGRQHLVLLNPLELPFPTRFLQGTADVDVDISVALGLLEHVSGDDVRLTLVKNADHRFSTPECLLLIQQTIENLIL